MISPAILLGLALSATSGLGYDRPGAGLAFSLQGDWLRVEGQMLSIEKTDGGEGWGLTGTVMGRLVHSSSLSLWAGLDGSYQSVSAYASQALLPRLEVQAERGTVAIGAFWAGSGGKIEQVVGLRVQAGDSARFVGSLESVRHSQGRGHRASVSILWRFP